MFMSLPVLSAALGAAVYKVFSRRRDSDAHSDVAVVVEHASGALSALIPSVSYLDCHETDADHIAMALTDAMKSTENLIVTYKCSDANKSEIESTINKICLLSTNEHEREGLRGPDGGGGPETGPFG